MVTKQQQLEWFAKKYKTWPEQGAASIGISATEAGKFAIVNSYVITRQEWQQERDKMSSKPEVDNSWHERGELPPVGVYCCGYVTQEDRWIEIEVIAHRDGHALGWSSGEKRGFRSNSVKCFRPLRTEREKAIDEMADLIAKSVFGSAKCQAEKLYEAGYRKVKS